MGDGYSLVHGMKLGGASSTRTRDEPSNPALNPPVACAPAGQRPNVGRTAGMRTKWIQALLLAAGALLLSVGCFDPGWSYHVPDPPLGTTQPKDDRREIALRVRGTLSTSVLSVEIALTNVGSVPLVVREGPFRVLDASHRPLPWHSGRPRAEPCEDARQKVVTLDPAQVCTMRENFKVNPSVLGGNSDLKTLTVVVDGLEVNGAPVSRSVMLERD